MSESADSPAAPRRIDVAQAEAAFRAAISNHEQTFGRFFLARLLGFEISYGEDSCTVRFEARDFMFNPQGTLHGGIIALAMDVSMGHFLQHAHGVGSTLEMKTQYLRALGAGPVRVEGRSLRSGRSICFLESRLYDGEDRLAAMATATWKLAPGRPGGGQAAG